LWAKRDGLGVTSVEKCTMFVASHEFLPVSDSIFDIPCTNGSQPVVGAAVTGSHAVECEERLARIDTNNFVQ